MITYGDGAYVTYTYDSDSERVVQKAEYLASGTLESSTMYSYDDQNRLTGIVHKEGNTEVCEYTYTYDVSGRTLSETVSYDSESGKTTSYAYDAEGRLVKVTYPSSSGLGTMNYTYDAFGNIQNIKKGSSTVREYTYDAFNRVTSIRDYDKPGSSSYISKSYVYDEFGRTTSAVYTEDGDATKVLESYVYTYDKNDNILTETRISNLPTESGVINETRAYVYDAYGRLTKSTKTDHTDGDSQFVTTYEYDAVGNRVKMTEGGMVTTYDYNGLNQLEKADTTDAEIEYTYDERGNQVLESNTTTEETVETTYNVAGEMVQLVKKSGSTTTLTQTNVYNQDGIRISRTQGDTEREYYYNNGVVAYTEDNNSLSSANIQNDDGGVIGTYRGSTYYNYFKNMQGSTESIVSESGETTAVYTYSDFGETEEVVVDTIGNEICYTGAIYDKDTGLYYMNARYYDADTGRFISQDSYRGEIDDVGTWHLYVYCSNNPVNYVDPSGHASLKNKKIYIDPGHGGSENGAVRTYMGITYKEKNLNLKLANKVSSKLKNEGAIVYQSRYSDIDVTLKKRYTQANKKKVDIFVSIHHNASRIVAIKGAMVLYAGKHDVTNSKSLAKNINNKIKNTGLFYNRGIKKRTDLAVLNGTKMPAVLTETGYMSHYNDLLTAINNRNKIASSIVAGIKAYY